MASRKAKRLAKLVDQINSIVKNASVQIVPEPPVEPNEYLKQSGKGDLLENPEKLREELRKFANSNPTFSAVLRLTSMFSSRGPHVVCEDEENREILDNVFPTADLQPFFYDFFREYLLTGECTSVAEWDKDEKRFTPEQIVAPEQVSISMGENLGEENITVYRGGTAYELNGSETLTGGIAVEVDQDDIVRCVHKKAPWDTQSYPYFATAVTALYQIESLNSALKEQLSELATPLIVVNVGTQSLNDGLNAPNIPTPEAMQNIANYMREVFMAKFRVAVLPVGVEVKNAFSGAQVADLQKYYDNAITQILQTVGMGKGLLDGSTGGPYASNAINRDVYTSYIETLRKAVSRSYQTRINKAITALDLKCYRINEEGERAPMFIDEYGNLTFEDTGKPAMEEARLEFDADVIKDVNAQLNTIQTLQKMEVPISKDYILKASGLDLNLGEQLKKLDEERDLAEELGDNSTNTPMNSNPSDDRQININKDTEIKSPNDKRNME